MDPISHALFWSMLANVGAYIGVSLAGKPGAAERTQAILFVDAFRHSGDALGSRVWRGNASADALRALMRRFLGAARADSAFARFAHARAGAPKADDAELVQFMEIELAGAIGAASARAMMASVLDEQPLGLDEVMAILDEASQVIAYSRQLEQKSTQLEVASSELKAANARLTELDHMKDNFISTVSHELRTPLTSIRAFSEILRDHPQLADAKRNSYLDIIIKESERLTRLINEVLDLAKIESGSAQWRMAPLDMRQLIEESAAASAELLREQGVALELHLAPAAAPVCADHDRLVQVMLNLLSNAAKFCDRHQGRITVSLDAHPGQLRIGVADNGPGVLERDRELIFQKFRQGGDALTGKPQGTGLGLSISREIIEHFGGKLWVEQGRTGGALFVFTLPQASSTETIS
jgi:signal transduction histidine kinase